MKHIYKKALTLTALASLSATASSQTLRSSYFVEGSVHRHQLNPAFMGESGYFSMPVLGGTNVSMMSNVGIDDFIYTYDDPLGKYDLTSFMSGTVSSKEFLDNIKDHNKFVFGNDLNILSFGFKAWGGFNTFGMGLHTNMSFNLPSGLFRFIKEDTKNEAGSTYHMNDLEVTARSYVDLSFGHARDINDKLTLGGKFKVLLGLANGSARFDKLSVYMAKDKWIVNADGEMNIALDGSSYQLDKDNVIDGIDTDGGGLGGYGIAFDFGGTYKLTENIILSAAITDLGFINWKSNIIGKTNNEPYEFNGFENIAMSGNNDNKDLGEQFEDLGEDLSELFKFYDNGTKALNKGISTTFTVGAEYKFKYYDKLSFGLLSTTRINNPFTWTEARLSANVSPLSWFSASVNGAVSTFGPSLGWMLNFHPSGVNFFFGSDHTPTSVTPQFVPIRKLSTSFCFGLSFNVGKYN